MKVVDVMAEEGEEVVADGDGVVEMSLEKSGKFKFILFSRMGS